MRSKSESTRNRLAVLSALQLLVAIVLAPAVAFPATVTLGWDPSDTAGVAGYKVYYQANSADIPLQGSGAAEGSAPVDVAQNLSATLNGLDPANSYFFAVTAYDEAGVESAYSNVVEKPEALPPTVAITSPVKGAAVSGEVVIAATASDNKGVTKVEFYVNGLLTGSVAAAPYSYAWNTSTLPAGDYTVAAKAFDAAGNVGEAAITVAVSGDSVSPVVALTQPWNNSLVNGTVNITATASDDVALSRIEFLVDGALIFGSNQSPASYGWNSMAESNGNHVLAVRAYDAAGNMGESLVVVKVANDRLAPEAALLSPAAGATVGTATTAGGVVEVSASASDDTGVTRVEFYLNGALQHTALAAPYRFAWDSTRVSSGSYTLSASAYDASGKIGASPAVTVTVSNDTVAPAVAIANPLANSRVGGSIAVSATASDNVSLRSVELYLDGALKGSFSAQPYSLTLDTRQLANGTHTLSARAYDAAGNIGESASVALNVFNDEFAPGITSFSMPAAANTSTVSVTSFTAMDNVGVTGYLITESSTVPSPDAPEWTTAAPASFTFSATGIRTAYAWARDAAGHVSIASTATVTVDTVLPLISSMTFVNATASVALNASGTDNIAVAKMEVYVDDLLQLETKESSLSYVCSSSSRSQKVTVKVFDTAGNTRSRTMRVSKN
jgi:chitinase